MNLLIGLLIFLSTPAGTRDHIPAAAMSCGEGQYECGDLEDNGTCCWQSQRCCTVPSGRGNSYCVNGTDTCNRY